MYCILLSKHISIFVCYDYETKFVVVVGEKFEESLDFIRLDSILIYGFDEPFLAKFMPKFIFPYVCVCVGEREFAI